MANTVHDTVKSRRVAILAADGVQAAQIQPLKAALEAAGAQVKIVAPTLGTLQSMEGTALAPDMTVRTAPSVTFDGVLVPGGAASAQALAGLDDVLQFIRDAYKHCKVIGALGEGETLLAAAHLPSPPVASGGDGAQPADPGLLTQQAGADLDAFARQFIAALAQHRHWAREQALTPPA
jgi:catalase